MESKEIPKTLSLLSSFTHFFHSADAKWIENFAFVVLFQVVTFHGCGTAQVLSAKIGPGPEEGETSLGWKRMEELCKKDPSSLKRRVDSGQPRSVGRLQSAALSPNNGGTSSPLPPPSSLVCDIRERPDMMSVKFSDFLTPPPCLHLALIYRYDKLHEPSHPCNIRFSMTPIPPPMRTSYLEAPLPQQPPPNLVQ